MCYLGKTEYEKAVKEFLIVMEKNPNYRKNIYLLISIAFKKLDNIPSAIRMVNLECCKETFKSFKLIVDKGFIKSP